MAETGDVAVIGGPRHEIAYRRTGAGQPVVLLHPLALSSEIWSALAARLSATFDVIMPDARGHGRSGWDGEPFGIDDLADDVRALLDGLGLPSAHVIGMSMGGSIAVSFAGRYPGRVTGMVLADTTAWYGANAPETWEERARGVVAQPRERQVPFQVDRWFTERFRQRNPGRVNDVVQVFLRTDSLAHAAACRALGTMDSRGLLAAIISSVLVLTGEEDYATPPAMGQAIADGVPDGRARVMPGLRHLSLMETPTLADEAAAFLTAGEVPA
jgi:3-oxoadipate enol-lactonase